MAMPGPQRLQSDFLQRPAVLPGIPDELREWMARAHFVMAVCPKEEKGWVIPVILEYVGEKIERCRITPLKVVYEQRQGIFLACQGGQKPVENVVEPVERFNGWKRRDFGLGAYQDFQLRDDIGEDFSVISHDLQDPVFPELDPFVAFGQKGPHQGLERLNEGAVRAVLLVDVEFPGCEIAPVLHDRLLELLNQASLSYARRLGNEERAKRPSGSPLVFIEDDFGFSFAADHLRDEGNPMSMKGAFEREFTYRARLCILIPAPFEVGEKALTAPVAFLGLFEEHFGNDFT